jgi:hypothetical protein
VQRAKELLELVEDRLSLQPHHAEWLSSPYNNSFLLDIRACSELALVKVRKGGVMGCELVMGCGERVSGDNDDDVHANDDYGDDDGDDHGL